MFVLTQQSPQSDDTSPKNPYMIPYIISVVLTVLLLVVFRIIQVVYGRNDKRGSNKLTLLPLGVECAYLVVLLANNIVQYKGAESDNEQEIQLALLKFLIVGNLIDCFFWTALVLVICLEWQVITELVIFQSSCDLSTMGIKKEEFNGVIERRLKNSYVALNILNFLVHSTVLFYVLVTTNQSEIEIVAKAFTNSWISIVALYLTVFFARLVHYGRNNARSAFISQRKAFVSRLIALYIFSI